MKYVFKFPQCLLRFYAAICSVAQDAVEAFSSVFIERKLKSNLSSTNLAYLVQLLEGKFLNDLVDVLYKVCRVRCYF